MNRKQAELITKKTLAVILVGVFLFTNTLSWAKEEELFSAGTENTALSSRPADNSKLAPWSRFDIREFKDSLAVASICKHIEHDGNLDDKSYLNDVLARLDASKNPNIIVLPYEIIIEIPEEGLAIRYFDPTKANIITPYADISKLSTKVIGPRLNRQIIHRIKVMPLIEVDEVDYMNRAFFRAYFTDYINRKVDLKVPERSIYQDVDTDTFLKNGRSKIGMVMPSISEMNLSLFQLSQAENQPSKDFLYFMPLKENMAVDPVSGKLAIRTALYIGPDRVFKVLRFSKPLPLDKVFYHGFDTNFAKMLEDLGYSQISHFELTRDKTSSKEYCKKAGVSTPAYAILKDNMTPNVLEETVKTFAGLQKNAFGYVVKPVDESQGHGVKMFKPNEIEKMIFYAKRLLKSRKQILIEERIPSYPYYENKTTRMDWNMRALAGWNGEKLFLSPETIEIRYKSFDGDPVNVSKGAGVKNFKEFLIEMGFDNDKIARLFDRIRSDIEKNIKTMGVRYGFFGFDLILGEDETLYTIEINSGPVGGPKSLFDINLGDEKKQWAASAMLYEFYGSLPEHKRGPSVQVVDKIDTASGDVNVIGNLVNILWGYGKACNDMRAVALAKERCKKLIDDFPNIWIGHRIMSNILLHENNLEGSLECSAKAGMLKAEDGGFHQELFLSSPAFDQVTMAVVSLDDLFKYGHEYDTSHKGLPVARGQELIKREEGMRDCREMMNWPLEDVFDFFSLYQWKNQGSVESRICNFLINRIDDKGRADMAEFLRRTLLLIDNVPFLPSLQDVISEAVKNNRWSFARAIFMLPPEYAAKLIATTTGYGIDDKSKLFGILRDRHLIPESYRENLDRIFNAYLDEILYTGDRNELRRVMDEIVAMDNISDYSRELLDVIDNAGRMQRIRELMNGPYFLTFLKQSWDEKFLQPISDWRRQACERMPRQGTEAVVESNENEPKSATPAKDIPPNDASLNSRFDSYLEQNNLSLYTALRKLYTPEIINALLEDPALRPVFLLVLPEQELGPLNVIDSKSVGEIGGEEVLLNHSVFSVGTPEIADKLAKEGQHITIGVTDKYSKDTFMYTVSNGRQVYFPLPDGTWLGIKGSGQFADETKPPYFTHPLSGVHIGLAEDVEAARTTYGAKTLRESGGRFVDCLGYRRIYTLSDGHGGLVSVKAGLSGAKGSFIPVLIYNRVLSPHRLEKFPQILSTDPNLKNMCIRISHVLSNRGDITKDKVLSSNELIMMIAEEMGRTEALKQNHNIFKITIHSQDITFAGEEADNEEIVSYEEYINRLNATPLLWDKESKEFLSDHKLSIAGIIKKIIVLYQIIQYSKDKSIELPLIYHVLKGFFAGYFRSLDNNYFKYWTEELTDNTCHPVRSILNIMSNDVYEKISVNEDMFVKMILEEINIEKQSRKSNAAISKLNTPAKDVPPNDASPNSVDVKKLASIIKAQMEEYRENYRIAADRELQKERMEILVVVDYDNRGNIMKAFSSPRLINEPGKGVMQISHDEFAKRCGLFEQNYGRCSVYFREIDGGVLPVDVLSFPKPRIYSKNQRNEYINTTRFAVSILEAMGYTQNNIDNAEFHYVDVLTQTEQDAIKARRGDVYKLKVSDVAALPISNVAAESHKIYIDKNKELFEDVLGEKKQDALVRIPIEAIESVGIDNIKDFLATFQEAPNGYVELYYMSGVGEVSENIYQKYGLQKEPLPKDFKRTRENTVTLFPAFKGEDLSKFSKSDISTRLGGVNISPGDTILSPIGLQHDPAGLIRATIFGLKIMNIARQIREKGVDQAFKDNINQEILHELRNVYDAEDFDNFNLTPDDIIALATGNINNILVTLKKLIKLLPITPINAEELRQIYEHVKAVIAAA